MKTDNVDKTNTSQSDEVLIFIKNLRILKADKYKLREDNEGICNTNTYTNLLNIDFFFQELINAFHTSNIDATIQSYSQVTKIKQHNDEDKLLIYVTTDETLPIGYIDTPILEIIPFNTNSARFMTLDSDTHYKILNTHNVQQLTRSKFNILRKLVKTILCIHPIQWAKLDMLFTELA